MPLRTKLGEGGPMAEQGGHLQRDKGHSCPLPVMERRARKPRPSAWAVQLLLPLLNSVTLFLLAPTWWLRKSLKLTLNFSCPAPGLGTGPGRGGAQALQWVPFLQCAVSLPGSGQHRSIPAPASLVLRIHIFLTQTIQSFNTWRLQSKPFVHTRSGNTLNNRPVS